MANKLVLKPGALYEVSFHKPPKWYVLKYLGYSTDGEHFSKNPRSRLTDRKYIFRNGFKAAEWKWIKQHGKEVCPSNCPQFIDHHDMAKRVRPLREGK